MASSFFRNVPQLGRTRARQGRAGQGRAGQGRAGAGRAGQGRAGRAGEGPAGAQGGPGAARGRVPRFKGKRAKIANFGQVPPRTGLEPPRSLKSARKRLSGAPCRALFLGGPKNGSPIQDPDLGV